MSDHSVKAANFLRPVRVPCVQWQDGTAQQLQPHQSDILDRTAMVRVGHRLAAAAFTVKRIRTREPLLARTLYLIPVIIGVQLLFWSRLRFEVLTARFVPPNPVLEWFGVALTAFGILFTFWARFHIGRNWSGQVVIKEQHELIRSGPYARVRHPIYTGLLLAIFGTALALGEVRGLIGFVLVAYYFFGKAKREERVMSQEFGEQYAEYRRRTGMLVPR
jgi:protein-S-isoprenylcysteine O-methyltransferase Ste14